MKYIKSYFNKNNNSIFWFSIFFNKFLFLVYNTNIFFFKFKKILVLYLKFFYFKKLKNVLNFLFLYRKHNKIINLTFFLFQKLKSNLYNFFFSSSSIILLQGRGFRLVNFNRSILSFKLGFTHNVNILINQSLTSQVLTKNSQKFKLSGNVFNIIQILGCLNYLKKKNIFTSKGIFILNEKFKQKKSTKVSW